MPETKPTKNNVPTPPRDPLQSPTAVPAQTSPDQIPHQQAPETLKAPDPGIDVERVPMAKTADDLPIVSSGTRQPYVAKPPWAKSTWILLSVVLMFLFVLIIFSFLPRYKGDAVKQPVKTSSVQENTDLSNYSAFVAQNRALLERKSSETILTDEPFAGQASLVTRANGPLASPEADPQLAALVDAFRIRVQVMQGSQSLVRNQVLTRVTKGDLRGFKVQAIERVENGKIISEEAQVTTPRNGLIKTVSHVLDSLQRIDLPGVLAELKDAGMEFVPLPALPDKKLFRGQLRFVRHWGKPIPQELLITGNGVGGLTLGVPVAGMKSRLLPTYSVLKRKVLVSDTYHTVFKVMDQGNEPLFYVYEKKGKVSGILIINEAFKTGKGIGINSSLDLIRLFYPQVKLAYSEKKTPFVRLQGVVGIFIIQSDGDKKVISILIGESPEFE